MKERIHISVQKRMTGCFFFMSGLFLSCLFSAVSVSAATNLTQEGIYENKAVIQWTKESDEASYEIHAWLPKVVRDGKTKETLYVETKMGATDTTSFEITGLTAGYDSRVLIRSFDAEQDYLRDAFINVQTLPCRAELNQVKLKWGSYEETSLTSGTGKQTSLTYNLYADVPIIENADGYQMEIYDAKGKKIKTVNQKQMDSSVIRIAAKDLKQNGCSVRVRGYRSFQKKKYYSAWSSKRFALRQPMCAARPYRGNLMIRWEAIAGATGYDVYLSDEKMAESFRKVKSVKAKSGQSVYQLTIKKIKKKKFNSGKKYYYYVIAKRKKSGETVFSAKSFKQFIVKM